MKKALLLFVFLSVFIAGNSTHITNGFVEYTYLGKLSSGEYRYKVSFIIFRDCAVSPVRFDEEINVGIYNPNRSLKQSIAFKITTETIVNARFFDSSTNTCYRKGVYEKEILLPSSSLPYTIVWVRCCRPDLKNIYIDPAGTGNTFFATIRPASKNNSPVGFTGLPILANANQITTFSMASLDNDGHKLKYKLVKAIAGSRQSNPSPNPEQTIPAVFPTVSYNNGFNEKDVFGPNPSVMQLDSITGIVTFKGSLTGRFVIAMEVEEWDSTTLIGKNYIEQHVIVSNYGPAVSRVTAASAASDIIQKRILINWTHSVQPIINQFTLERRTDNDSNWKNISLPGNSSFTFNFTDSLVEYDTTYWYLVSAHTGSGVFVSNITKSTIHKNTFPVAVKELGKQQIQVYPNPASGIITVETNGLPSGIKLVDIRGRLINIETTSNTLDLSDLPAGIYYLEIQSGGAIYREKIVKVE